MYENKRVITKKHFVKISFDCFCWKIKFECFITFLLILNRCEQLFFNNKLEAKKEINKKTQLKAYQADSGLETRRNSPFTFLRFIFVKKCHK